MNIEIYKVPEGQNGAGMYTFRINGQESLFYSSNEEGLNKRIKWLFEGKPKGLIQLKAIPLVNQPQDSNKKLFEESKEKHWAEYDTLAERLNAFMTRGKLGKKLEEPKDNKI